MGGIEHVARGVIADLEAKVPRQRKTQRGKLGFLVASMLEVRSANRHRSATALSRMEKLREGKARTVPNFLDNGTVC